MTTMTRKQRESAAMADVFGTLAQVAEATLGIVRRGWMSDSLFYWRDGGVWYARDFGLPSHMVKEKDCADILRIDPDAVIGDALNIGLMPYDYDRDHDYDCDEGEDYDEECVDWQHYPPEAAVVEETVSGTHDLIASDRRICGHRCLWPVI